MRGLVPALPPHQHYVQTAVGLEIRTYSADELREQKLQAVNEWNEAQQTSVFEYAGHLFDYDKTSRERIPPVALSGSGSPLGYWTTYDNKNIPADAEFMKGLYWSLLQHGAAIHHKQRKMKDDLLAMTDPAEIAAYEVPTCP